MDMSLFLAAAGVPAKYLTVIGSAIGTAAVVAAALPVPASKTSVYGRIYSVVNFLAANFGNAANAKTPAA